MVGAELLLSINVLKCSFVHRIESQKNVDLDFDNTVAILTRQSFAVVC